MSVLWSTHCLYDLHIKVKYCLQSILLKVYGVVWATHLINIPPLMMFVFIYIRIVLVYSSITHKNKVNFLMNPQYFVCLAYFRWGHDVFSPFCQSSLPWSYGHIVKLDKNMMWTFWNIHFIGISPKFYIALKYDSEINVFFFFQK